MSESAMPRPIDQALDRIVQREDDFAAVLTALFRRRYSGALTIHFRNGRPRVVELPGVQVTLPADPGPTGGSLDTPPPPPPR